MPVLQPIDLPSYYGEDVLQEADKFATEALDGMQLAGTSNLIVGLAITIKYLKDEIDNLKDEIKEKR
jgi:hypothetical protein